MRRSWLVQRLQAPQQHANPFSFGGGLVNGGLSTDAMKLLSGIFSFDYMGAAEFEFGAVPKALQAMAKDATKLSAWSITIPLAKVKASWNDKRPAPHGGGTVYILAPAEWRAEVEDRIRGWAGGKGETKESVNLNHALRPFHEWDSRNLGWLELDNGFMFFTDGAMWEQTCNLFSVKPEVEMPA